MKKTMGLIALLFIAISAATFDRNYYADELKITNKCLPHMGLWGEQTTPERGWSETIENCSGRGSLETLWKVKLASNVVIFGLDGNRLESIVYANGTYETIPNTFTDKYSTRDAANYASGMVGIMANALENRIFMTSNGTCVYLSEPILKNFARDAINSYHYVFPYVHVVESNDGWCFEKP